MSIKRLNTILTATLLTLGLALAGSVSFASEEPADASTHKFDLAKQYYAIPTVPSLTGLDRN